MNGSSHLRGLTDVRTSVSTHGPARPRRRESVHLELYRLEKERQRLEVELCLLLKRAERVSRRVHEIDETAAGLLEGSGPVDAPAREPGRDPMPGWRRLTVGY